MNKNNDSSHYTEIPIVEITAEEVIAYINSFFKPKDNNHSIHEVSVPIKCQNCSLHENRMGCTQCSRDC
jgi:hypothetical protein